MFPFFLSSQMEKISLLLPSRDVSCTQFFSSLWLPVKLSKTHFQTGPKTHQAPPSQLYSESAFCVDKKTWRVIVDIAYRCADDRFLCANHTK